MSSPTESAPKQIVFDIRTVERNIKKGHTTRKEYEKHLKALPDVAANVAPPDGGPVQVDLPLAQHTIDVIAMLQEKTRGNLTDPEAEFLEGLLFDLRLRYVERSKSAKPG